MRITSQAKRCTAMTLLWVWTLPLAAQQDSEVAATQYAAMSEEISRYEQELASLEGSYNQSSAELYRSLGDIYARMGQGEEAIQAYREALQALRIAEGLASENQLSVISKFNGILFEQEAWEELDTNFHLASDMALRLYGAGDTRYVRAASFLASWKIRAYQTGLYRPTGSRSIEEAATIYRRLAENLSPEESGYNGKLADYLSARGLAYFYSASHVANIPVEEFQGTPANNFYQSCVDTILSADGSAQPSSAACQMNNISDPEFFASKQRDKSNTVRRHLGNMRQSFLEAIEATESNPDASVRDMALAILNYGDANLLAEDYPRARTQYARAYEMLSADDDLIALRGELMDKPRKALQGIVGELPFDDLLPSNVSLGTISFDVTEVGGIENINIEGSNEALAQENIATMAMMLQQSAYRPRIVDGIPVSSRISIASSDL